MTAKRDLPRVLVVDDEPDDVAIARRELGSRFKVESVGSAAEGLERLTNERFDLVVLDYRLGDMNALSFLREIQAGRETAHGASAPTVIVVSGRNDPRVAAAAHELGAYGFLAKDSFGGGALAAAATEALGLVGAPERRPPAPQPDVLSRMSEGLYAVDEDGVIVLANAAFERLLGYGPLELLGVGLEHVMGPEALGAVATCLASGSAFVETDLTARSRASFPVLVSPTPLVNPGGHVAVVRDFRDIRSRIGNLEKANRKLQDNLVEVAVQVLHNVGNAAASLDVRVEDLSRELASDDEALRILQHAAGALHGQRELVALIRDAVSSLDAGRQTRAAAVEGIRRGIAHVGRAIDYARSFAGKTKRGEPLLDLPQAVEMAVLLAQDVARSRGVTVRIDTDIPANAPRLQVPEASFEQLLVNLLKNAVESVAARAALDPAAPRSVSVLARIADGRLRLEVSDTGQGATPEVAARAFQFGFTTKPEGSGFGLHSSAEFVERLGGRIALESPGPDQGATVIVEVPLSGAARAAA